MLPDERKVALREGSEYGNSVVRAYPLLQAAGAELAKQGVRFTDLTDTFAGIGKPLYIDDCCHVSAEGNAMIGRRIGEIIAKDYAAARREKEKREQLEAERAAAGAAAHAAGPTIPRPASATGAAPAPVAPAEPSAPPAR
jgi:hypothetical protein